MFNSLSECRQPAVHLKLNQQEEEPKQTCWQKQHPHSLPAAQPHPLTHTPIPSARWTVNTYTGTKTIPGTFTFTFASRFKALRPDGKTRQIQFINSLAWDEKIGKPKRVQARAKGMEKQLQCGDGEEHETRAERTKYKMKKKKVERKQKKRCEKRSKRQK